MFDSWLFSKGMSLTEGIFDGIFTLELRQEHRSHTLWTYLWPESV